ncbi:MAG TPA: ABC transporter permease [Chloroflexia bacterium]|nr:ABC transporter permease [Chloroflexia bacterium]
MRNTWTIAVKELRSFFVSPVGYVALAFWLFGVGLFFALGVLQNKQASMQDWFGTVEVLLLFIGPALTMRLLAEEQRTGTMEVLMTSPVREWEVVLGKFLGTVIFWIVMVAVTLFYPLILKGLGNPDMGPIFSGYLGLLLMGASFLAIGVFTSSLSSNQVIAYIIAFVVLLGLWIIGYLTPVFPSTASGLLSALSVTSHFDDFGKGVVDLANILFYLSIVAAALFATVQILETRRARL